MPNNFFFVFSTIHSFALFVFPITLKSFGNLVTSSAWLIQTLFSFFVKKSFVRMLSLTFLTFAKPNSLDFDCLTLPPSSFDIIW